VEFPESCLDINRDSLVPDDTLDSEVPDLIPRSRIPDTNLDSVVPDKSLGSFPSGTILGSLVPEETLTSLDPNTNLDSRLFLTSDDACALTLLLDLLTLTSRVGGVSPVKGGRLVPDVKSWFLAAPLGKGLLKLLDRANVGGCLGDAEVTEDLGLALVTDSALIG